MNEPLRFCSECIYLEGMHSETGEGKCTVTNELQYGWETDCEYFTEYTDEKASGK